MSQIGAALRPAFAADTAPHVTAMACQVSRERGGGGGEGGGGGGGGGGGEGDGKRKMRASMNKFLPSLLLPPSIPLPPFFFPASLPTLRCAVNGWVAVSPATMAT